MLLSLNNKKYLSLGYKIFIFDWNLLFIFKFKLKLVGNFIDS